MNSHSKETRKQKRLEILGSNNPICIICGEDDWRCLEQHHIAGKLYSNDLCNICRNCHRKVSDDQEDHPNKTSNSPETNESIGHLLLGLADLFALLVKRFREIAHFLISQEQKDKSK